MADFKYDYARSETDGYWDLEAKPLLLAILTAFPAVDDATIVVLAGVDNNDAPDPTNVVVRFADDPVPDKPTLDAVVAAEIAAFDPLPPTKAAKIQLIRDNTDALISQGALYNAITYMSTSSGRFEVLSTYAIGVAGADATVFPVTFSSTDGETETEFANAGAFAPFFAMMRGTYRHWKDTSQVLRQEVLDAVSVAEVDAVVDNRTWPWVP
jgi:hypothetical protein